MALKNLFSNELVNRRRDQNNIPESSFTTDITQNKIPRTWNSLNTAYKAISSPKYFKTSLFSSFISGYKKESKCIKDCYTCKSHCSVEVALVNQKIHVADRQMKKNHLTHLS